MPYERAKIAALPKLRSIHATRWNNFAIWRLLDLYTFECRGCGVSHIERALFAVNLDAIEDKQSSEKPSSRPLFSELDALEGSQILRACRKRLRVR